jgi:hypothetical protein
MNDTPAAIISKFNQLMMAKSGQERLLMGFSMFDTAKQIVKDALHAEYSKISPQDLKQKLFLRFYGGEFDRIQTEKILHVQNRR